MGLTIIPNAPHCDFCNKDMVYQFNVLKSKHIAFKIHQCPSCGKLHKESRVKQKKENHVFEYRP